MTQNDTTVRTAEHLIALGQHMLDHPGLPKFCSLSPKFYKDGYRVGLELVLAGNSPISDLVVWAQSLTDVTSSVHRYKTESLHAFVYGRMAGVEVLVWAAVPGEGFPTEPGDHEWDVTVQLQEA